MKSGRPILSMHYCRKVYGHMDHFTYNTAMGETVSSCCVFHSIRYVILNEYFFFSRRRRMGVNVLCAIRFSEYRQWRLASIAFGLK